MNRSVEKKIVRECLSGNANAFEVLVDEYQKPIFNMAYRIVNNYNDAEDIAQNVFIKAYKKLKSYNAKYRFFSWIILH